MRIRIRPTDLRIRIRIRTLLFSSVTFKMPTKNLFFFLVIFAYHFLKVNLHRRIRIRIRIRANKDESGRSKNIRILQNRIHNTGSNFWLVFQVCEYNRFHDRLRGARDLQHGHFQLCHVLRTGYQITFFSRSFTFLLTCSVADPWLFGVDSKYS